MNHEMFLIQKPCAMRRAALLISISIVSILLALTACASTQSSRGPFLPASPGSLRQEQIVDVVDDAEAIAHIAWIDSVASHKILDPEEQYSQWNIRVGLSLQLKTGSQTTPAAYRFLIGAAIRVSPRLHVEVQHIRGEPIETAIDLRDRYDNRLMSVHGGPLGAWRVLHEEDTRTTYLGATGVALGVKPEPGVYRMRLKADGWSADIHEGLSVDESWQTFIITEVGDEPAPVESLPWYDLPKEPNHPE